MTLKLFNINIVRGRRITTEVYIIFHKITFHIVHFYNYNLRNVLL